MSYEPKSPVANLSEAEWVALSMNAQAVVIGLVNENRQLKLTVTNWKNNCAGIHATPRNRPHKTSRTRNRPSQRRPVGPGSGVDRPGTRAEAGRWYQWSASMR